MCAIETSIRTLFKLLAQEICFESWFFVPPRVNSFKDENCVLQSFKETADPLILPVDKGNVTIVFQLKD